MFRSLPLFIKPREVVSVMILAPCSRKFCNDCIEAVAPVSVRVKNCDTCKPLRVMLRQLASAGVGVLDAKHWGLLGVIMTKLSLLILLADNVLPSLGLLTKGAVIGVGGGGVVVGELSS